MKIFSWNINGLRAVLKKGSLATFLEAENPDILCLQEIKCKPDQIDFNPKGYEVFWNPANRAGYSGTMILSKLKPKKVFNRNNLNEGRVLILEFENFFLVNVYTPNSKRDLTRLKLRHESWDPEFLDFLKTLEKEKPVVTCGDFNAANEPIDLARPKDNIHNAGFTKEEREGIKKLLSAGFIDTFRSLHPEEKRYTWWSHFAKARERNIGWRIDYFFISKSLKKSLLSAEIHESYLGSDHCPISIEVNI